METPAEVPPLLLRSSSSSNEINVPMCPPKLANFRYGREEMLALCPEKLPDIQELSDQFPDFHSAEALPPVCFQQYTEEEEVHIRWSFACHIFVVFLIYLISFSLATSHAGGEQQ